MQILKLTCWIIVLMFLSVSCSSKKERVSVVTDKKVELQKLKNDKTKTEEKIKALEAEIAKLDTGAAKIENVKLVSVIPVSAQNFQHYIDLQGRIDAENISYISPRGMGGQVRQIFVRKGDYVKKGQLLLKLDDAIARQNVVAMRQSMGSVKTQLDLARSVYQRQKNLWNQNIGTEVQLLQAATNVKSLENQIRTMQENVKIAQEQLNLSNVYSNVFGVAEEVNIHVGETFTGSPMAGIKIINTSSLKVVTDVPENYLSRIKRGTSVQVVVADINRSYPSSISLISQSVSSTSRGFTAEARIPYDVSLKPGQSAVVKILDYSNANGIVIPVNLVQTDESSKYVYILEKLSNGKMVAKKKKIVIGEVYGDNVEIKTGLIAGEQLISEGYQSLYEGQAISTSAL
ncbi:MAG TPA: efflux RND transporter periplasmic adaptor subunit [Chitinophagaceae bacterium]|nr:efflux RND transporter periplasmic adaptor subunit [Chitinophagaceae bacterium]